MIDKETLNDAIMYAMTYERSFGLDSITSRFEVYQVYDYFSGPSNSYYNTKMRNFIDRHLPIVLSEMGHENLAKRVMRQRIIFALGG